MFFLNSGDKNIELCPSSHSTNLLFFFNFTKITLISTGGGALLCFFSHFYLWSRKQFHEYFFFLFCIFFFNKNDLPFMRLYCFPTHFRQIVASSIALCIFTASHSSIFVNFSLISKMHLWDEPIVLNYYRRKDLVL